MDKINVLLTCVSGPGGISAVNSLKVYQRYRLYGVDSDPYSLGLYSKYLTARYCVDSGDSDRYVEQIEDIVKRHNVKIIFPMSDEEVTTLSSKKEYFKSMDAIIPIADNNVVTKADDKLLTVRIAEKMDVRVPKTYELSDIAKFDLSKMGFPLIIKPRIERGGKGVVIVNDKEGFVRTYNNLSERYAGMLMVQEYIPGGNGTVYLFAALYDQNAKLKASFLSRSLCTKYTFGGPGEGGEPVKNESLKKQALEILDAFGDWFGPVNIEFKLNRETGEYYLLEVNPRYWGYSYLATAAGINFPHLAMKVALGEDFEEKHGYRTDIITMRSREDCVVEKKDLVTPLNY